MENQILAIPIDVTLLAIFSWGTHFIISQVKKHISIHGEWTLVLAAVISAIFATLLYFSQGTKFASAISIIFSMSQVLYGAYSAFNKNKK